MCALARVLCYPWVLFFVGLSARAVRSVRFVSVDQHGLPVHSGECFGELPMGPCFTFACLLSVQARRWLCVLLALYNMGCCLFVLFVSGLGPRSRTIMRRQPRRWRSPRVPLRPGCFTLCAPLAGVAVLPGLIVLPAPFHGHD